MHWHTISENDLYKKLSTSRKGLNSKSVEELQQKFGPNKLPESQGVHPLVILKNQLVNPLVIILFFGALFAFMSGEYLDSGVIFFIIVLNTTLGFWQELKAERAIESLKTITTPHATVIRDGKEQVINSHELIPGDFILLSEGDKVPADARLVQAAQLKIDEALLTGESVPENKSVEIIDESTPLADRTNMVYSGTHVAQGRGEAIVTSIGLETEIGKIAQSVHEEKKELTPLQKRMEELAKLIGIFVVAISVIIVLLGIFQGREFVHTVEIGISLAVSAVPEGLAVIITIALALGVRKMLHQKALVRRLPVVEVLGSANIMCTDKTGTLTTNQMTVTEILTYGNHYAVTGTGFDISGDFSSVKANELSWEDTEHDPIKPNTKELTDVLTKLVLCSDATAQTGDPTERALITAAMKYDLNPTLLKEKYPREGEVPFTSDKKYMISSNKDLGSTLKGATENILNLCTHIQIKPNETIELTSELKKKILTQNELMAKKGLRVLSLAHTNSYDLESIENSNQSVTFIGLVGMIDPARPEVPDAITQCKNAGIRVIMITGDHALTAESIAKEVGIESDGVLTGPELDALSPKELAQKVRDISIYARVTSQHKLQILKALQKQGNIVGMGGDGVNDAPAVKRADIGFSVDNGTDLTKEVADMILLDSNFATIPKAVREGRIIYQNIRNFLKLMISSNFDEVLLIITSLALNIPLVFAPIHILWINLLSDGLPSTALALDSSEEDVMSRKPRNQNQSIFSGLFPFIIVAALIAYVIAFGVFSWRFPWWEVSNDPELLIRAQTMVFTTAVLFELFLVFICRTKKSVFSKFSISNPQLLFAVSLSFVLLLVALYIPALNPIFKTVPLTVQELSIIISSVLVGSGILEFAKVLWYKDREF
ncbi:cation-translocating P-type ATPase [Candidatus Dojkabacteria bacterium]|uniref:P-type Cu(+) transporter n=1 Tax=Candidatus Dojkabacteria bacterium TaxID=2099670 RepID=A0A955RKK2_9BACT|nr:cation-translocating P-type ATPase [Candidatus Dojkabacteria bacterium]